MVDTATPDAPPAEDTTPVNGEQPTDDTAPDAPGTPFRALLIQEGVETSDDRFLQPNALTWREPPVPLMVQLKSEHGGFADTASEIGGRIDTITRAPLGTFHGQPQPDVDGFDIIGEGMLDAEGEIGVETARLVAGKFLLGVSADLAVTEAEVEITAVDDDGWPIGERFIVTAGELGMATVTPFPAFGDCQIELLADAPPDPLAVPDMPEVGDRIPILADGQSRPSFTFTMAEGCIPCEQRGSIVAAGGPLAPPAGWFDDPQLGELTPLTVLDDGRVFGHLAGWGQCHTGSAPGSCTTAPRGDDYTYFETGALVTAEGDTIPVGQLTLAGGHADLSLGYRAAAAHYDDTDSAMADVRVGEDAHGIWLAGALRPAVTDEQVRAFRASPPSGDWRPIGGRLRLVAACSVNVQGFPIRRARVASGQTVALIAGGVRVAAPSGSSETSALAASGLPADLVSELNAWRRERQAARALASIDRLTAAD